MAWLNLVEALGLFTIAAGILAFLLRSLLKHILSRDLAKFEAELASRHGIQAERLRADLNIAAFEHQTRFTRFHERRAEVLDQLYKRIWRTAGAFEDYTRPLQWGGEDAMKQKRQDAAERANELINYFGENKLYVDESLAGDIEDLIITVRKAWSDFTVGGTEVKPTSKEWLEVHRRFKEKVPTLFQAIEGRMRKILAGEALQAQLSA